MISLKEATELISNSVTPINVKTIPIANSLNCKLAGDLHSPINVPGFDNSAMDGIAIRYSDLQETGPWKIKIQKTIAAGDSPSDSLQKGCAVKIMTGAPLPEDADTVIIVEDLIFHDDMVEITERPKPGKNVRPMGDSLKRGDLVFRKGHILKPVDVGILASIGLEQVRVIPKPEIAIISTGSEIVAPGSPLLPGQIYNSNDTALTALLNNIGFNSISVLPPAIDDLETLYSCIDKSLLSNHLVITTGGVSMGDFDYIPHVVKELGGEIIFHKVIIKPGKPALFAKFNRNGEHLLLGLPGNPVSTVVGYHLYVKQLVSLLMGIPFKREKVKATLTDELRFSGFRQKVNGVTLAKGNNGMSAIPALRQQSGRLASIGNIDGFIYIDGGNQVLPAGLEVEVELL
ncbi:MAG: molybdopterin molybdotransferase MoeA [Candidatus Hatepunaea meridiana]|nr:molybdopterin molybdotransferase MoeA [Candidatus Hatepunaea meridiana]